MQTNLKVFVLDSTDPSYQIIKFVGEFDKAGHADVRDDLNSKVRAFDKRFLVFDFTELKFINSEGIGYLMEVHAHLLKQDKKLVIIGVNDHVKDVFETIGINEIVSIYDSLEDFLKK